MHINIPLLLVVLVGSVSLAAAQQENEPIVEPQKLLQRGAMFYGYPGSMVFRTVFQRSITTRYILLKAATRLPDLKDYLKLNERQLAIATDLKPFDHETVREDALGDKNAEPDEQIVDASYFDFLSADQLSRLDRIAMWFDGYASLSRISVANRLELSKKTRATVSTIVMENRKNIFLPYARWEFAAPLPPNHNLNDCEFSGRFVTHINHQIINAVTLPEVQRIVKWVSADAPSHDVIEAIKRVFPLPEGLLAIGVSDTTAETKHEP